MTVSKGGKIIRAAYLIFILLFLYLPIGTLMVLSFNKSKSMSVWTGFTTHWYSDMFKNTQIMEAIWNTFSIAIVSAIIATIVGTMACIGLMAMGRKANNLLMGLNNIPLLNADIVIGISLMMTFLVFGISLSWGTVLLSHVAVDKNCSVSGACKSCCKINSNCSATVPSLTSCDNKALVTMLLLKNMDVHNSLVKCII